MQVLHATVIKQLEIAELLENLRASKCRVSSFLCYQFILSDRYQETVISFKING